MRSIRDLIGDKRGGTLIEYGLILALIFVVMAAAFQLLATQVVGTLDHVKNAVVNASGN